MWHFFSRVSRISHVFHISRTSRKWFVAGLTLDNVSRCTSQLTIQITWHEIEGDRKEEKKPAFGNYISNFVYGFCLWYTLPFFIIIGCKITRWDSDLRQNDARNALYIFQIKTENWYFFIVFSPNYVFQLCVWFRRAYGNYSKIFLKLIF